MNRRIYHSLTFVLLLLLFTSLYIGVCVQPVHAYYTIKIQTWDILGWPSESIQIDGNDAGMTPVTASFDDGTTHTIKVPTVDHYGYKFDCWDSGSTSNPLTISSAGTYTAQYGSYHVHVQAWDPYISWSQLNYLHVYLDGKDTGLTTPCTVTGLVLDHSISVPSVDYYNYPFARWASGETSTSRTVQGATTLDAYYMNPISVSIAPSSWTMDVGQSKLLTATASGGTESYTSYQWATPIGNNLYFIIAGATSSMYNEVPAAAGSALLAVSVTDSLGDSSPFSSTASVTVNSALSTPVASASPNTVNQGQSFTLSLTGPSGGTPPYYYQWHQYAPGSGWLPIAGATSDKYVFSTSSSTAAGIWYFMNQVVDSASSGAFVTSNSVPVTVNALPVPSVSVTPGSSTMDMGQSKTFSASASGGSGSYSSYQWYVDGVAQSGATSSIFNYSPASAGSHSITVTVTDSSGTTSPPSSAATVTVNSALVAPTVSASVAKVDQGQTSSLTSTAVTTGTSPYTYQWLSEAPGTNSYTNIAGATSSSYSFATTTSTTTGGWSFELQVTDSAGASVTSSAVAVTVNSALVAPTVSASAAKVDQGQTSSLTSTAITTGTSPYTYQWLSEAPGTNSYTNISAATSSSYSFLTTTSTASGGWSFELWVMDNAGASVNSTAVPVTVNSALSTPSASASPVTVNQGQSSTLSITGLSGGTTPYTYQWLQKAPGAGSYSTISGATSNSYVFSTSTSSATGSYSFMLQVTDSASTAMAVNSSAVSVTVNSAGSSLAASVSPSSWTMDVGQSKLFTATASGGSGSYVSYQWYVGGIAVSGQTASTYTCSAASAGSLSITVTVTDSLGSTSPQSSASAVTVNSALSAPTASASPGTVNQGQSSGLTVSAVTSGTSPYTYQWFSQAPGASFYSSIGGAASSGYNFATSTSTTTGTWNFIIQVTDSAGASVNSSAASVTVNAPGPTPTPTPSPTPGPSGQTPTPTPTPVPVTPTPTLTATPTVTVTPTPSTVPSSTQGGVRESNYTLIIYAIVVVALAAITATVIVLLKRKSK